LKTANVSLQDRVRQNRSAAILAIAEQLPLLSLKRVIERLLVQPLANLMVTDQIHHGDRIAVTRSEGSPVLNFLREAEVAGRAAA
jgi:hypothetical protein